MSEHPDPSAADELLAPATLAEARKVCEAATPGPWYWHDSDMVTDRVQLDPRETDYYEDHGRTAIIITDSGYYPPRENDRAFIVLARTLLPALIDRVEALTDLERYVRGCIPEGRSIAQHLARLDELEAEVERLRTCLDSAHEHRRVVQARADKAESEVERVKAIAAAQCLTDGLQITKLQAEVERLRVSLADVQQCARYETDVASQAIAEMERLRSEARENDAAAEIMCGKFAAEVERLRAGLSVAHDNYDIMHASWKGMQDTDEQRVAEIDRLRAENEKLQGTVDAQRETGEPCYSPDEADSLFAELKRLREGAITTEEARALLARMPTWAGWLITPVEGDFLSHASAKLQRIAERQP